MVSIGLAVGEIEVCPIAGGHGETAGFVGNLEERRVNERNGFWKVEDTSW